MGTERLEVTPIVDKHQSEWVNWDALNEGYDFWDLVERIDKDRRVEMWQGNEKVDPKAIVHRIKTKALWSTRYQSCAGKKEPNGESILAVMEPEFNA